MRRDMTDQPSTSALATANAIRRSLGDFARHMRSLRDDHGVSASKLSVLGWLRRAGRPLSASELARLEKLQPQSLTRIIAELHAEGFIECRKNSSDKRQLDIQISEKGTELLTRDARRQNEWLVAAMEDQMTNAERAVLSAAAEVLDRVCLSELRDKGATGLPGRT